MSGFSDEPLEIHPRVTEARTRRALNRRESLTQGFSIVTKLHPDAATARRTFQHQRKADAIRFGEGVIDGLKQAGAGKKRNAASFGDFTRLMLQSERIEMLRTRPNEGNAMSRQGFGKAAVFRQEAIARMHRLSAGCQARRNDGVDIEIALRGGSRADPDALVGLQNRPRKTIRIRIHGDRCDTHTAQRSANPPGNFAAVGNQDFAEHAQSALVSKIMT